MTQQRESLVHHACIRHDAEPMRTTVDLPSNVHERARKLAAERGVSMSAMIAELAARGLSTLAVPPHLDRDPESGLPVIRLGRRVTDEDVAAALDDD